MHFVIMMKIGVNLVKIEFDYNLKSGDTCSFLNTINNHKIFFLYPHICDFNIHKNMVMENLLDSTHSHLF